MSDNVAVECGHCGGTVYMETCDIPEHDWVVASECQRCGARYTIETGCPDCEQQET